MIYRAQIAEAARTQIGVRWQHQAALKDVAADCRGLLIIVAGMLGIPEGKAILADARFSGYGRIPDPARLLEACAEYLNPGRGELGDILLLRFEREPQHFALISRLKPRRMIHAYAQARKVVENGIDHLWMSRVVRTYSFRGIDG